MNRRIYNRKYRGIINFFKARFNLKRQLKNIIGVIIILILLLFLKILNNSITDNIIQIIYNGLNYKFSLKEDGKAILDYSKRALTFPERALTVFNFTDTVRYNPPIKGTIYKPFGEIRYLDGRVDYNNGIDIIPKEEKETVTIEEGIVEKIEDRDTKGYFVTVNHESFKTVYGYLTKLYVKEGESLNPGTKIGTLGTSKDGNMYLHFELWVDGNPVNPLDYLNFGN
ncbi:MAG: M23 family metallopeptidase [Tissierellia bacterium]|nr:M23 family metallopeptidase [Tissierellia bacterium]